jgi:hypothetical protein
LPDKRKHRGPHPEDQQLFAQEHVVALREATRDLSWLLTRGYASVSALKIVGDRYSLTARQRIAVARCACSEEAVIRRKAHQVDASKLPGQPFWIDGYNVLTSIESALAGGVILHARDGTYRDMASMHGTYRSVEETIPAILLVGEVLSSLGVAPCHWLLDKPVSNSGRLKAKIEELAAEHQWSWDVELSASTDRALLSSRDVVASADSQILDGADRCCNLVRMVIYSKMSNAWVVDLSS